MTRLKKNLLQTTIQAETGDKFIKERPIAKTQSSKKTTKTGIEKWLGQESGFKNYIHSEFDILTAGQQGITKSAVEKLAVYLGVNRKTMAESILSLSVKTLERKDKNTRLDKRTSSHALEIARLMQHGYAVFEDEEKLKFWVNDPNKALSGKKPVELFDTLTGLNMVNDVLTRIEEGVYS